MGAPPVLQWIRANRLIRSIARLTGDEASIRLPLAKPAGREDREAHKPGCFADGDAFRLLDGRPVVARRPGDSTPVRLIGKLNDRDRYACQGRKVGLDNAFTRRNTTFMAWNLMHLTRMLKHVGGVPAHGKRRIASGKGERHDHPYPEYR